MTREEIVAKFKDILKAQKSEINIDNIKDETKMSEDLNIDSLDLVEIVMEVESEFDITIDENAISNLKSFGEIVDFVQNQLASNA